MLVVISDLLCRQRGSTCTVPVMESIVLATMLKASELGLGRPESKYPQTRFYVYEFMVMFQYEILMKFYNTFEL